MRHFDVLSREEAINRSLFIEASAGTGKTFCIENIVVRLLIEDAQCIIDRILVVTFTKAAARDLRMRIRKNIQHALQFVKQALEAKLSEGPDFLLAYQEKGELFLKQAKAKLEQALFGYDQADITTIHSFCYRALEGRLLKANSSTDVEPLSFQQVSKFSFDFLRTHISKDVLAPAQLLNVLQDHNHDIQQLNRSIYKVLESGYEVVRPPSLSYYLDQFQTTMKAIQQRFQPTVDGIVADFNLQLPLYKKAKEPSHIILEKVKRFAKLYEKHSWDLNDFDMVMHDRLVCVEVLDPKIDQSQS